MDKDLQIITNKSQADKAIHTLKGILTGITLDGTVTPEEVNELRLWVQNHQELVVRNPFREFMTVILETIEGNIPNKEAIEDLFWLTQKYEADSYYYNAVTTDLQTLQGICHGILSDGIIKESEVFGLDKWLKENEHLSSYYPYDEIRTLVGKVLSDGIVSEDEKLLLKAYFSEFCNMQSIGIKNKIQDEIANIPLDALCTDNPSVKFEDNEFCFTGILKRVPSRATAFEAVSSLGGVAKNNLTLTTNYLVVGDNGNAAWAFACYGRKVEKAVTLRKKGHPITIIHEFDFFDMVDDLM